MTTHLVWLRNDLRVNDNLALHAACRDSDAKVIALYLATPAQWKQHDMSPKQAAFIHASLLQVQRALAERGIELHYQACHAFSDSVDALVQFCAKQQVD